MYLKNWLGHKSRSSAEPASRYSQVPSEYYSAIETAISEQRSVSSALFLALSPLRKLALSTGL